LLHGHEIGLTNVKRFLVTIEAPRWEDVLDLELPREPNEGDSIQTQYGACIVTKVESLASKEKYDGKIVCRLP
jgi:hypothetical protein